MVSIFSNWGNPMIIESLELGKLSIDVVLTENHSYKNIITRYPVEEGFDITDNVKREPPSLTISGITSNTPVSLTSPSKTDSNGVLQIVREDLTNKIQQTFNYLLMCAGFTPVKQATGEIYVKENVPKLLIIITGFMVYRDMVITNLSFPRDYKSGMGLSYSITFDHIRRVSSKYENKPVSVKKAKGVDKLSSKTDKQGTKETKPVEGSLLFKLVKKLMGGK